MYMTNGKNVVVVPYFILIWYNQRGGKAIGTAVVVPYFILIWYNHSYS